MYYEIYYAQTNASIDPNWDAINRLVDMSAGIATALAVGGSIVCAGLSTAALLVNAPLLLTGAAVGSVLGSFIRGSYRQPVHQVVKA